MFFYVILKDNSIVMTIITIKNPKNFSLVTLKKLLHSLDIEIVKIENEEEEEIPADHLPVSYTHLDVYKRQLLSCCSCRRCRRNISGWSCRFLCKS